MYNGGYLIQSSVLLNDIRYFWFFFLISRAHFSKVPQTFRTWNAISKTGICLFKKASLLLWFQETKGQFIAKFHSWKSLPFLDTKEIIAPVGPKYFFLGGGGLRNALSRQFSYAITMKITSRIVSCSSKLAMFRRIKILLTAIGAHHPKQQ